MNIFALHTDTKMAAVFHTDKHVVKMITESVQMLSTAVRLSGIDIGYKRTHVNHPCAIWTRSSLSNYLWLRELVYHLHEEWKYRYDHHKSKIHKAYGIMLTLPIPKIKDIGLTPFALAMPEKYRCHNTIESYRYFYSNDKRHLHNWKKRSKPEWIDHYLNKEQHDFESQP